MWLPLVTCIAGLAAAPDLASQEAPERTSLEDYLSSARRERDILHARLSARVQEYLAQLQRVPKSAAAPIEAAIAGLAGLGVDATPLLVQHLELPHPTDEALTTEQRASERRAEQVAEALFRMPCDPIRPRLLELAEEGSPATQVLALRVLENCELPELVRPRLLALYDRSVGQRAEAVLGTLISIGGEGQSAFLRAQLSSPDSALVDRALLALATTADADAGPEVRALLADPTRADQHGTALLEYFAARPELVRGEQTLQLVRLAAGSAPRSTRMAVLEALPLFEPMLNYDLRAAMKPLLAERDKPLREAALVALASLGDRSSRKALLAEYDDSIARNDRWFRGYSQRAHVLLRIGENDAAIKDFRKALEYGQDSATLQPEAYLGLARAYARKRKLRDASEWLRKAPISLADLQALEQDPDFIELRNSRWGEEAFGR